MFGLTKLEGTLAAVAIALVAVIGVGIYLHFHLIDEGIADQQRADAAAVAVHDKQVADQHAKDLKDATDTIAGLNGQLEALREQSALPGPATHPVRLCQYARSGDAGRPAGAIPGGAAQPAQSPDAGGDPGVRSGAGAGPDIGPGLRDLALAGVVLADYHAACVAWAVKQSQPLGGSYP
jgi:hypothetical protein